MKLHMAGFGPRIQGLAILSTYGGLYFLGAWVLGLPELKQFTDQITRRFSRARELEFIRSIVPLVERPPSSGASATLPPRDFDEHLAVNSLVAPVFALDQNVGFDRANDLLRTRLLEHDYVVDRFQRREDSRALGRGIDGTAVALELAHAAIAVESDHQHVGLRARKRQALDMTDVQQIEASVGERDRRPARRSRSSAAFSSSAEWILRS